MHCEGSRNPRDDADQIDQAIIVLLISEPGSGPWALEELVREIGDRTQVHDSLARLYGVGLIHRLDGFVFASRSAARAAALL